MYAYLYIQIHVYVFVCVCVIGVWTQGFTLVKQVLYHFNYTLSHFCPSLRFFFIILLGGATLWHLKSSYNVSNISYLNSFCLAWSGPQFTYLRFPSSWDVRCMSPCPDLIDWNRVWWTFCLVVLKEQSSWSLPPEVSHGPWCQA
jgi:hypothetical protein